MTVFKRSWSYLLCPCILLCTTGVALAQFELQPVNLTLLRGSEAQINASVQGPWSFMTWTVGGLLVVTVPFSGNATSDSPRFSARLCSSDSSCVEFTIRNVTRGDSGSIVCYVQGPYGAKTAQLSVQESGGVLISGGTTRTVQEDDQVQFRCQVRGWFPAATVGWTLNGYSVNDSLVNTTAVAHGNAFDSTSLFSLRAVRNSTVTCLASVPTMTRPQTSSVQLVVLPKPTDWTVLIAIVLSFSLFALVILLIIGIIFCYKRRKEKQPTYRAEMMRQRTQSQLSSTRPSSSRQGQANPVFTIDGQTTGFPPSERDSGFFQTNGALQEQPGLSPQSGLGLELGGFTKHRHVTIV